MMLGPYELGPGGENEGIYTGDARILSEAIPGESVDLVLTDPPYGTTDGRGKVIKRGGSLVNFCPGEWDKTLPLWWTKDAMRILRDGHWLLAFTDKLSVKALWDSIERNNGRCKQTFYWVKNNPPPQPRKNFCSGVESAVCATKGAVKLWNGSGWTLNYFICPTAPNRERTGHPTQKPLALISYLVRILSVPDNIVFDPFVGSGTLAVACKMLGRHCLAFEIDPATAELARDRVRKTQPPLFTLEQPTQQSMEMICA